MGARDTGDGRKREGTRTEGGRRPGEAERGVERKDGSGKRSGEEGLPDNNLLTVDVGVDEESGSSRGGAEEVPQAWTVPDGGWGWVVVLSAMVISLIVDGLSYTFGLFLGEFERAFQQPKSTVSLVGSLQVGVYLFIGPVVSALINRFGCRPIIVLGSCLSGLAFVASSWSGGVTAMILTYGLMAGVGFGLMYLPAIVAVSIYFEKKRAVATGIAVCGTGVGTFLLAPLTDYLLYEYNWRGTLLILGGIVLNGAVFGALVRPLKLQRTGPPAASVAQEKAGGKGHPHGGLKEDEEKTHRALHGRAEKEQVPLISLTDIHGQGTVAVTPGVGDAHVKKPHGPFFSSTPAMMLSRGSSATMTEFGQDGTRLSPTQPSSRSQGVPPRRRAQSTSDHSLVTSSAVRPRFHAPIGLALISLSDVNLDQIRADVKVPLARKDIHLSGSLPYPDSDATNGRADKNIGLYIQSFQSIASLSAATGLGVDGEKTGGLWSCLPRSVRETMEEMLDLSILKEKCLWCVLLGNFFCMLGIYVPFVYIPERALLLGIPEDRTAFLISIIGITNTVGRVMTGVLINFLNLDCAAVTSVALLVAGITAAVCPFCHSYATLAAASAVYGLCVAAYISLCSVLICELLGVENLTNAFGFVILFRGVACMVGPPLAGAIIDVTGVFEPSFYLAGAVIVLGGLSHAALFIPCIRGRTRV